MKGLILKELLGMRSFAKGTLSAILIMSICFYFSVGAEGIIAAVAIMCATMIVTTYTLDERYGWQKYALAMPISRRQYIGAKYVTNLIFCGAGVLLGSVIALILSLLKHTTDLAALGAVAAVGLIISLLFGVVIIPLLTFFGAEKARMIMMGVIAVPTILIYLIVDKTDILHLTLTGKQETLLAIGSVGIFVLLMLLSYLISVRIFEKKEL